MIVTPRTDIPGTYIVQSGNAVYDVNLVDPFTPQCDCSGYIWRDTCKHVILCMAYRDGEAE